MHLIDFKEMTYLELSKIYYKVSFAMFLKSWWIFVLMIIIVGIVIYKIEK